MGILAKIFGAVSREEMDGISLSLSEPFWELDGETDFPRLFTGLVALLPENSILYFEGGSPTEKLQDFLRNKSVPERARVAYGTIWPRPKTFHVPASAENLRKLAELMTSRAYPELAVHFHVYREGKVILEWHDAFTQPMLVSSEFSAEAVQQFCSLVGMKPCLKEAEPKK